MTTLLDRRDDGSLALYIDGDLQFDSRDEQIYHEALALPALALAERRHQGGLRALICGGGDGLAARELLKSQRLAHLDLVDYDPAILALGRGLLATLNAGSLTQSRTHVATDDAWAFVERARRARSRYDVIVVDLTLPQDVDDARFHTIEWYSHLRQLLGEMGVLAVNAASPAAQADAYWSIYNSLRAAGLAARPYRVALPSFAAHGYGDDWGFCLVSPHPIAAAELDDALSLPGPRRALHGPAHLRRLFLFPAAGAARRQVALPTRLRSDLLLHYLYNSQPIDETPAALWDGLAFARDDAPLPAADGTPRLLPPELRAALTVPIGAPLDEQALFERVITLMPVLHRSQTRQMIAAFLEAPERFLAAIDLDGLVDRLLQRAAELPRRLVAELRLLRSKLRGLASDHGALLRLGTRIVTVVTLVVIVANLLYPDAVYGKGSASSAGPTSDSASLSRPGHSAYDPTTADPNLATNSGFRDPGLGRGASVDETGTLYPSRRYRYVPRYYGSNGYQSYRSGAQPTEAPTVDESAYRLTPETDILLDGQVVVMLTNRAYLLLGDQVSTVVDQETGLPLLFLEPEPAQRWRAAQEIKRQRLGLDQSVSAKQAWIDWLNWLEFAPWREDDERELTNIQTTAQQLDRALPLLGAVPDSPPPAPTPPAPDAIEVFSGVWMLPDGSGLALRLPDGLAFMDGRAWYRDQARTQPLSDPYPAGFKEVVVSYLGEQVRNREATRTRVESDVSLAQAELDALLRDKSEYDAIASTSSPDTTVEYGTSEIPLRDALQQTNDDIARARQRLTLLQQQRDRLPTELALAERVLASLAR